MFGVAWLLFLILLLIDKYNILCVRRMQKGAKVKKADLVNGKRFNWDSQF